ncbi:MAG: thiamine phosphate synthase [Sphingobium sp.]
MALIHRKKHLPHPTLWLFTDERVSEGALLSAVARLPRGSGVLFRHASLTPDGRKALFERVRLLARRGGKTLILAGTALEAQAWKADGWHSKASAHRHARHRSRKPMIATHAAHNPHELYSASRSGADVVFVSPVFATRSHPEAKGLGRIRLGLMIRNAHVAIMALGGMTPHRSRSLRILGISGWGAIDALTAAAPLTAVQTQIRI